MLQTFINRYEVVLYRNSEIQGEDMKEGVSWEY